MLKHLSYPCLMRSAAMVLLIWKLALAGASSNSDASLLRTVSLSWPAAQQGSRGVGCEQGQQRERERERGDLISRRGGQRSRIHWAKMRRS